MFGNHGRVLSPNMDIDTRAENQGEAFSAGIDICFHMLSRKNANTQKNPRVN